MLGKLRRKQFAEGDEPRFQSRARGHELSDSEWEDHGDEEVSVNDHYCREPRSGISRPSRISLTASIGGMPFRSSANRFSASSTRASTRGFADECC